MTTLTKPQGRIPVGWATVGSQRVQVLIDIEWDRFFIALQERAGGVTGIGTTDASSYAAMQPAVPDQQFGDIAQPRASGVDQAGEVAQPRTCGADHAGEVAQASGGGDAFADVMQPDLTESTQFWSP